MSCRRDKDLQRYFDGELSRRQAERVRRQVESSPEDQQRLANLGAMRGLLTEATNDAVQQASFDNLWAKVQLGVAAQQPVPLGERIRVWFRRYGLVAASAAAAAVMGVFLWTSVGEPTPRNDCEIESLEMDPGAVSTIFTIHTPENDGKTTVIWVNETPPEGDSD